jgi:FADH2 O2-dependent halogenase
VDDAAVHHVFPGGWMWMLRFGNGITSAGVAVTEAFATDVGLADGAAAWPRVLDALPSVRDQFVGACAVTEFVHLPRLAWRSSRVVGPGWALLPSAAGVIDPLLSTGFPLTLLGIVRLADAVHAQLASGEDDGAMAEYERRTLGELDATERLVAALYHCMDDFALFKKLSLLYFAAASFGETVRRLGRRERASSFLLCEDPVFGPALEECATRAATRPSGKDREALLARIDDALAPFDVAGLRDAGRRDWYPVRVQDLFAARERLGATTAEIDALIARCGLAVPRPGAAALEGAVAQ